MSARSMCMVQLWRSMEGQVHMPRTAALFCGVRALTL